MAHSDWGIGSGFREEIPEHENEEDFLYTEIKFRALLLEETV